MTPEFSRPERLDAIGEGERRVAIAANDAERAALAVRFRLVAIERLQAELGVRRESTGVLVTGRVTGTVVQACAITDEPLTVSVDEPLALRFVEEADEGGEEMELTADALDTLPIEGGAIDLGEAAAETLALSLDPFPRGPNAAAALGEAGVLSEGAASPFGALAGLKGKLGG